MSQSAGAPTTSDARNALLARREVQLNRVAEELASKRIRSKFDELPFFRSKAVRSVWRSQEYLHQVLFELSTARAERVWDQALLFVTFLLYLGVPLEFYSQIANRLFLDDEDGLELSYRDSCLPYSQTDLQNLGLKTALASRWEDQYLFIPATIVFNPQDEGVQRLESKAVRLPFLDCDKVEVHYGGYGEVRFFQVAPEYIRDEHPSRKGYAVIDAPTVAVKSFRAREDGLKEAKNMQLLKKALSSNGSISLHEVIIEQGAATTSEFFIIFPHAELGDLFQFLHGGIYLDDKGLLASSYSFKANFPDVQVPSEGPARDSLASALLEQCDKLASALRFLHEGFWSHNKMVFCAHMDLKPSNIIIFRDRRSLVGNWKICDFGISVFKDKDDTATTSASIGDLISQLTMRTRPRRESGPYQAPEIDDDDSSGYSAFSGTQASRRVGRSSDIWSFGGILGEVLAFALGGKDLVHEFQETRKQHVRGVQVDYFYSPTLNNPSSSLQPYPLPSYQKYIVRPQVLMWLDEVSSTHPLPNWVSCWAICVKGILQVDPGKRPDARGLQERVSHVYKDVINWMSAVRPETDAECLRFRRLGEVGETSANPFGPLSPVPEVPVPDGLYPVEPTPSSPHPPMHARVGVGGQSVPRPANLPAPAGPSASTASPSPQTSVSAPHSSSLGIAPPRWSVEGQGSLSGHSTSQPSTGSSGKSQQNLTTLGPSGIMCSPDRPRLVSRTDVQELHVGNGKPSAVHACQQCIAYLIGATVSVFRFRSGSHAADPRLVKTVDITIETSKKGDQWTGLSVGWPYLAVWGMRGVSKDVREPQLHVFKLGEHDHEYSPVPHAEDQDLREFDHEKRVAVSALGYVVVNRFRKLIVVGPAPATPHLRQLSRTESDTFHGKTHQNIHISIPQACRQFNNIEFLDIAVNDTGDLLFAWASVGWRLALLIYRLDHLSANDTLEPFNIGYYDYHINEVDKHTRLFPFNTTTGCVIAASGNLFFPAVLKASNPSATQPEMLPRVISTEMQKNKPLAASMFGNHSLVAVHKDKGAFRRRNDRLVEYALRIGENGLLKFDPGKELTVLAEKAEKSGSSVVQTMIMDETVLVLVCHLNGKVEIVRFPPSGDG